MEYWTGCTNLNTTPIQTTSSSQSWLGQNSIRPGRRCQHSASVPRLPQLLFSAGLLSRPSLSCALRSNPSLSSGKFIADDYCTMRQIIPDDIQQLHRKHRRGEIRPGDRSRPTTTPVSQPHHKCKTVNAYLVVVLHNRPLHLRGRHPCYEVFHMPAGEKDEPTRTAR